MLANFIFSRHKQSTIILPVRSSNRQLEFICYIYMVIIIISFVINCIVGGNNNNYQCHYLFVSISLLSEVLVIDYQHNHHCYQN